jgi:hypothetical protein
LRRHGCMWGRSTFSLSTTVLSSTKFTFCTCRVLWAGMSYQIVHLQSCEITCKCASGTAPGPCYQFAFASLSLSLCFKPSRSINSHRQVHKRTALARSCTPPPPPRHPRDGWMRAAFFVRVSRRTHAHTHTRASRLRQI